MIEMVGEYQKGDRTKKRLREARQVLSLTAVLLLILAAYQLLGVLHPPKGEEVKSVSQGPASAPIRIIPIPRAQ